MYIVNIFLKIQHNNHSYQWRKEYTGFKISFHHCLQDYAREGEILRGHFVFFSWSLVPSVRV